MFFFVVVVDVAHNQINVKKNGTLFTFRVGLGTKPLDNQLCLTGYTGSPELCFVMPANSKIADKAGKGKIEN